jgi:hypothetical protein
MTAGMRGLGFLVLALLNFVGSIGLQVPGWERTPIHGEIDGDPSALVKVYENVFDEAFLRDLETEAAPLTHAAGTLGTLRNGKRATFYMTTSDPNRKPRCAAEQAVMLLKELIYPDNLDRKLGIHGAKYWFQHRSGDEDVGFHFDKDEGMASDKQIMRFPYINTLLYLTDEGAPTVFFNQTVINNGNMRVPFVPDEAWLVYPKRNKFCLQRGDLLHGAAAWMAVDEVQSKKHRTTFVLSFEDEKPFEPNCHELTDNELPQECMVNMAKWGPHWDKLSSNITVVDPTAMPLAELDKNELESKVIDAGIGKIHYDSNVCMCGRWFVLTLHFCTYMRTSIAYLHIGMDKLHVSLPKAIEGQTTYLARWGDNQIWSELTPLHLDNEMLMDRIWASQTPVSILSFRAYIAP